MLNRLLRQQLLDLVGVNSKELEGGLHDAVEEESEVDQKNKAEDLEPLERLPPEAEGDDPDEQRAAGVNRGARCGADCPGHREAEEVEATGLHVSMDASVTEGRSGCVEKL
jgi:hypothetical protein